jgi:hypothetical protein
MKTLEKPELAKRPSVDFSRFKPIVICAPMLNPNKPSQFKYSPEEIKPAITPFSGSLSDIGWFNQCATGNKSITEYLQSLLGHVSDSYYS